jgi:hypothetical protein
MQGMCMALARLRSLEQQQQQMSLEQQEEEEGHQLQQLMRAWW